MTQPGSAAAQAGLSRRPPSSHPSAWLVAVLLVTAALLALQQQQHEHPRQQQQQERLAQPEQQQQQQERLARPEHQLCPSLARRPSPWPAPFWLVKTHKTGSSTLSGVLRGIAATHGPMHVLDVLAVNRDFTLARFNATVQAAVALLGRETPLAIAGHLPYDEAAAELLLPAAARPSLSSAAPLPPDRQQQQQQQQALTKTEAGDGPAKLLRFTSVRHPLPRFFSAHFHSRCYLAATAAGIRAARGYACDTDAAVAAAAAAGDTLESRWAFARQRAPNPQLSYISGHGSSGRNNVGIRNASEVVQQYDFVFVTERMNEALVAFMLSYGLRLPDVAYLPAKVRHAGADGAKTNASLDAFVLQRDARDLALWHAANQALDARRAALAAACGGRDVVGALLPVYERLLQSVQRRCGGPGGGGAQVQDEEAWHAQPAQGAPAGLGALAADAGRAFRCVRWAARAFAEEQQEMARAVT